MAFHQSPCSFAPTMHGGKIHGLLATARVANVPSVISNVFTGAVIGSLALLEYGQSFSGYFSWAVCWACLAGVLLYLGGNFLNDWRDFAWDQENRPERALPSGLFCRSTYLTIAIACFLMGGITAWSVGWRALIIAVLIVGCVLIYTETHKSSQWGVVWVALCRGLLIFLGVSSLPHIDDKSSWVRVHEGPEGITHSLISISSPSPFEQCLSLGFQSLPLVAYIIGLSISARYEAKVGIPVIARLGSLSLLFVPVLLAGIRWIGLSSLLPLVYSGCPYLLWIAWSLRSRRNVPEHVSRLLAGIPLVDGLILIPAVMFAYQALYLPHPASLVIFPVALLLGSVLQRVAPAT